MPNLVSYSKYKISPKVFVRMNQIKTTSISVLLIFSILVVGYISTSQLQSSYSTTLQGSNFIDLGKLSELKKSIDPLLGLSKGTIIEMSAKVTSVDDRNNLLGNGIKEGDIIKGYYIYDSSTSDTNGDSTVGDYQHNSAPFGITLFKGNFVFKTDPKNTDFLVELVNRADGDNYLLRSYNNLPLSNGVPVQHIAWQLDDPTAKALSSDSLKQTAKPPVLSKWSDNSPGLTIELGDFPDSAFIRAHVTSVILLKP